MRGQDKAEAYYHLLESMADEYEVEYNPAPGQKWQAINGVLRMPNLNGTEMAIAACLIDHAHNEHGFAFPSRKSIQSWTGRPKSSVDRALGKLKRLGLIEGVERRRSYTKSDTTLYSIVWQPFFRAFEKVEAWKLERRNARNAAEGVVPENGPGWSPISGQVVPENGEHISLRYLSKDNLSRSPYGDPVIEIQKGHPGGTSCEAESSEQLTAGFNGKQWWMDRLKDTRAEIKNTTDPKQRKRLEETVARCLAHIEELPNEQRTEVGGSRG